MLARRTPALSLVAVVLMALLLSLAPPVTAAPGEPGVRPAADQFRWSRHHDQDGRHDYGTAVAASADAIYVAGGSSASFPDEHFTVLRYALDGGLVWAKQLALRSSRQGIAEDIAMLPDGGLVVTGYTYGEGGSRLRTMVLEPDGSTRWSRSRQLETDFGLEFPPKLAVGPDGMIFVAGSTGDRFLTLTYGADGEPGWTRRVDPVPGQPDAATAIAVDNAGSAYVTGPVGGGFGGFTTVRIRPSGKVAWRQDQQGALTSTLGPAFVALAPDGRVVVTGVTESTCGVHAATTWSLDARRGTRAWLSTYPALPCHLMEATGLAVRADGSVVVVGSELGGSDYQGVVVSYAPDGTQEWATPYGTSGTDLPAGIVVEDGTAFVAGATDMSLSTMDVLTGAVARDGTIDWLERFDSGSSSERPADLVLVPGGELVVTGHDFRPGPAEDVLTLSYRRQVGPSTP